MHRRVPGARVAYSSVVEEGVRRLVRGSSHVAIEQAKIGVVASKLMEYLESGYEQDETAEIIGSCD